MEKTSHGLQLANSPSDNVVCSTLSFGRIGRPPQVLPFMASLRFSLQFWLLIAAISSFAFGQTREPDAGLPDRVEFLRSLQSRVGDQVDEERSLKGYVYRVDHAEHKLKEDDTIKRTETFEVEVYHFDHGPFRKLLSENGVSLAEREVRKQEIQFLKHAQGDVTQKPAARPWLGNGKK